MPQQVKDVPGCQGCPMAGLFPENNFVPCRLGKGTRLAIAEAPGELESELGEPLVGGSGNWLRGAKRNGHRVGGFYPKIGVKDEDITFINVINCRPPDNVFPTDAKAKYITKADAHLAVKQCIESHVAPVIRGRHWTRIDLLGDKPLKFIAGKDSRIGTWRGTPLSLENYGYASPIAIATYHPSYVGFKDQTMIPIVINDLRKSLVIPPENYNLYPSLDNVRNFTAKIFAFDIENDIGTHNISMVGLSAKPTFAMVVPFHGAYIPELKRIFNEAKEVIGQNIIQHDLPILADNDIKLATETFIWDIMLMHHLVFPQFSSEQVGDDDEKSSGGGHDLGFIGSQFTSKPNWKGDKDSLELYNARDTDVTIMAFLQLKPRLVALNLLKLYSRISVPLAKICWLLREQGIRVDPKRVSEVRRDFQLELVELAKALPKELRPFYEHITHRVIAPQGTKSPKTGKPLRYIRINCSGANCPEPKCKALTQPWRSPKKVAEWLYSTSGVQTQTHIDSGQVTTNREALERVSRKQRGDNPEVSGYVDTLLRMKKLDKLVGAFLTDDLGKAGMIHASFNVHGTASGRLSSSNPNMQQVPIVTRFLYVPSHEGWRIGEADYSQIENRLVALFANDTDRLARFLADPKFSEHKWACSQLFNIPIEKIVKDNSAEAPYSKAKHVVHGCDGGLGARKISLKYNIPEKEVKLLLKTWKEKYIPKTVIWQNRIGHEAKQKGFLYNPFGRYRPFYTNRTYTEALRQPAQSTAADIMLRCMLVFYYERIGWPLEFVQEIAQVIIPLPNPARMLISVHDSLVFEYPNEMESELREIVKTVMQQPWRELGGASFPIEWKSGLSWGEVK